MGVIDNFKRLPVNTQRLMGFAAVLALFVALPLFLYAVLNGNFELRRKATSGEVVGCVAIDKQIFVSPEGQGGNCHDIQAAVNAVDGSGFLIKLSPGTYNISNNGIDISGKQSLTIEGDTSNSNGVILQFASNWGFNISNSSGSIAWMDIRGNSSNGMMSIKNSSNFSVAYSQISDSSAHAVDIQNSANVSIVNTNVTSSANAIEITNSNDVRIYNNRIQNSASAIRILDSYNVDVRSNLIIHNRESAISAGNVYNTNILYNTMTSNGQSGYPTVHYTPNTQGENLYFSNNIVAFNGGPGIEADANLVFREFSNNDFYSNIGNYLTFADQTGTSGNISADPRFNVVQNYCLDAGSPAAYGVQANNEYMGYQGLCFAQTSPSPSPSPSTPPSPNPNACSNSDVNKDGITDITDYSIFVSDFFKSPPTNPRSDMNSDGIVDITDYSILVSKFFTQTGACQ